MQAVAQVGAFAPGTFSRQLLEVLRPRSPAPVTLFRPALMDVSTSALPTKSVVAPAIRAVTAISGPTLSPARKFMMNGKGVGIPMGVSKRLTVSALKAIASVDSTAIVFIRRGSGDLRLEDGDVVEIREGELPTFTSAVPWTTQS